MKYKGEKKFLLIETMKIHKALEYIKEQADFYLIPIHIILEDARMNAGLPKEFRKEGREQGAGSIKRDCVIIIDFLDDLIKESPLGRITYSLADPRKNKMRHKFSDDPDFFMKQTGWHKKGTQHEREAASYLFGL